MRGFHPKRIVHRKVNPMAFQNLRDLFPKRNFQICVLVSEFGRPFFQGGSVRWAHPGLKHLGYAVLTLRGNNRQEPENCLFGNSAPENSSIALNE
jgi:hypothetical protein